MNPERIKPLSRNENRARTAWKNLTAKRGRRATIRKALDLPWQAVDCWKHVPLAHVFAISEMFSIPPEDLRPDFFCDDPLRRPGFEATRRGQQRQGASNRSKIAAHNSSVPMNSNAQASAAASENT